MGFKIVHEKYFNSLSEMADFARTAPTYLKEDERSSQKNDPKKWSGTENFEEAIELAGTGWREKENLISSISEPIFTGISSLIEREDIEMSSEGHSIDISKFIEGEPECWQNFIPTHAQGTGNKVLRLVFNGCTSSDVSANIILHKGAAIVALVTLLEFAGYRAEVLLGIAVREDGIKSEIKTCIKKSDQPLDLARLTYALCHASVLRRLAFAIWENADKEIVERMGLYRGGGYGTVTNVEEKGDITITDGDLTYFQNRRDPKPEIREWVTDQLKAQGIALKETI